MRKNDKTWNQAEEKSEPVKIVYKDKVREVVPEPATKKTTTYVQDHKLKFATEKGQIKAFKTSKIKLK